MSKSEIYTTVNSWRSLISLGLIALTAFAVSHSAIAGSPRNQSDPIRYVLTLTESKDLQVELWLPPSAREETRLQAQVEWGGVANEMAVFHNLTAEDGQGQSLPLELQEPFTWVVRHPAQTALRIQYMIRNNADGYGTKTQNDYRTRLDANLLQMIGELGLVLPQAALEKEERISIEFVGFENSGWQVVSSWGPGSGPFHLELTGQKFRQSVILAGKINLIKREVHGKEIGVAVVGNQWTFRPEDLADALANIVEFQRIFFDDHTDPWYLVTLTPVPMSNPGASSFGGTAVTNCFALFCTPNLAFRPESPDFARTLILLAHEYFHNWNGIKIPTAGHDPSTYWFSEGFTNYYARRLLYQAGLIDKRALLEDLNNAIRGYFANPEMSQANAAIKVGFWQNRDLNQLPYQRGDLVALLIDEHIKLKNQGIKSLDDFMRELWTKPLNKTPITNEDLFDRLSPWVDADFLSTIRQIVEDGETVTLPPRIGTLDAQLVETPMRTFDPGIDLTIAQKEKKIAGVIENGNAWSAGLRNGQQLKALSVDSGDNPPIATVTVVVDGKEQTLQYEALSAPQKIRQYHSPAEQK